MFSKISTMKYTEEFLLQIRDLKKSLEEADAIVIGAGAGLSTSAGFIYDGERFTKHFSDFEEKYGFKDMYNGGFYPFETPEESWGYWSRFVYLNRYCDIPNSLYRDIYEVVKDKNYFVITTNVDHCFQRCGFDKERLFYMQGDFGLFQCSVPCHNGTYENKDIVLDMVEHQVDMKIPSDLIPRCPRCGEPMAMNLRGDDTFVQDEGWEASSKRYADFINTNKSKKILFLELGVGFNTPSIIKFPFIKMTRDNENAKLISINYKFRNIPSEKSAKYEFIEADIKEVFDILLDNSSF